MALLRRDMEACDMIKNEAVARQISELMLDIGGRLDQSVADVQESCSPDEFRVYRRAVGAVMAEILLEIMDPLYAEHPSIKPPGLN